MSAVLDKLEALTLDIPTALSALDADPVHAVAICTVSEGGIVSYVDAMEEASRNGVAIYYLLVSVLAEAVAREKDPLLCNLLKKSLTNVHSATIMKTGAAHTSNNVH